MTLTRTIAILALAALLVSMMSPGAAETITVKGGRTVIGDVPWDPAALSADSAKVVYGTDDRIDVYAETDAQRRLWANATCALVSSSQLSARQDGNYQLSTSAYRVSGYPPCSGEPFGNQPTAAFCTGFMVGEDIIATAGHCYEATDLAGVRFLFGFAMTDASTIDLVFSPDQVYTGVELLGRELNGSTGADYSLIRVDRPIVAPGATPLQIRREGVIPENNLVGVIGHPSGLPMKIAFGSTTRVRDNTPGTFFVANLDTYGGNSGSPVFNAQTGLLEGILVRGEQDFELGGSNCFVSYQVADSAGRGEDVTKATIFADLVPEVVTGKGIVWFAREALACGGIATMLLNDVDLEGQNTVDVTVTATGGDEETVTLEAIVQQGGQYAGDIALGSGPAAVGNGTLEAADGVTVRVTYEDADDGTGSPATAQDSVPVDCMDPVIGNVNVSAVGGRSAQIGFTTSETATGYAYVGASCASAYDVTSGPQGTTHSLLVEGLTPQSTYFFRVEAADLAENRAVDDNAGQCHSFTTLSDSGHVAETFDTAPDLEGVSLFLVPLEADGVVTYELCRSGDPVEAFPVSQGTRSVLQLGDDSSLSVAAPQGKSFRFHGVDYAAAFVGSNGYITFTSGDTTYSPSMEAHFALPRISALFRDLDPNTDGTISVLEGETFVAFDYVGVVDYGTGVGGPSNTFQVVIYDSGAIQLTYLELAATPATVGLSAGGGTPDLFEPRDLSAAPVCDALPGVNDRDGDGLPDAWEETFGLDPDDPSGVNGASGDPDGDGLNNFREHQEDTHPRRSDSDRDGTSDGDEVTNGTDPAGATEPHDADLDGDWRISVGELLRVVQMYDAGSYHCDGSSEDGFAPGSGDDSCAPHHGDLGAQDFVFDVQELLRLVQLFHAPGYGRDLLTDDTFVPVQAP